MTTIITSTLSRKTRRISLIKSVRPCAELEANTTPASLPSERVSGTPAV